MEPALEPESLSLRFYLGRDRSALRSSQELSCTRLSSLDMLVFLGGKYFCKCLLFKAGWQTISAGLSWTRCFFKAPPYYDRSLAHTHTHPHTQGKDRPGFCEISSYNFIPFFERGISADTVKTSTWRQDEEQKTMKFNNLEEGRKKCKLVPQSQREGGGTMERTLRCSDVFL